MTRSRLLSSTYSAHVAKGRRVIELEAAALRAVQRRLDENFARAVEAMREVIQAGHKIIVTGIGKSGTIGAKIASTLSSTGASSVVLDAVNASHGDLGMVSNGDLVLILSYSGETEEVARLIPSLKRIGTRIVALTGNREIDPRARGRNPPRRPGAARSLPAQPRAHLQLHRHAGRRRCARHGAARGARLQEGGLRHVPSRRHARAQSAAQGRGHHAHARADCRS